MILRFSSEFAERLKKVNVRVRKSFKQRIAVFYNNPNDPLLNSHPLRKEWQGYRSIDITNDWRAVYTEKAERGEVIFFFVAIGTHKELYK